MAATNGTPDMTNVTGIKVAFAESSGSTAAALVAHIAAVAHYPKQTAFPNGVVTFSFDDNYASPWSQAATALDKYGFGAQRNVIRDGIDTAGCLTTDQLHQLENLHHWEVSGHAYYTANHNVGYSTLPAATVLDDASRLKGWLRSEAFKGADHFAWPLGREDTQTANLLREYFATARHVDGINPASFHTPNRMRVAAYTVNASTTVATITGKIDNAYANGKWLQLISTTSGPAARRAARSTTWRTSRASWTTAPPRASPSARSARSSAR